MTENRKIKIREIEKDSWEGIFNFDPGDGIYGDHFLGYPVVPGSLIVHAFLKACEDAGFSGNTMEIENFGFRQFLLPGHYPFRIELRNERVHCAIRLGDKKLVSGILKR